MLWFRSTLWRRRLPCVRRKVIRAIFGSTVTDWSDLEQQCPLPMRWVRMVPSNAKINMSSYLESQARALRQITVQSGIHVQQIPDNHTMLNHTTLLFAPNLPGINRNINKFALIITQKSPDNHTMSSQFSTFTAFIYELLLARKYCLWFLRLQRQFASVSII